MPRILQRTTWLPSWLAVTLLALLTCPASAQTGGGASSPEADGSAARSGPARELQGNRGRGVRGLRIWWNQPEVVEALGLGTQERQSMDAVLQGHIESRRKAGGEVAEARRRMMTALSEGAWEDAEAARADLLLRSSDLAAAEADLAEEIMRLLTPAQRKTLGERFPVVLRRPWLFGGNRFGGGPGAR